MADLAQGMTLEYVELADGRYRAILTQEDGKVILDKEYKNRGSAYSSVGYFLNKNGKGKPVLSRVDPDEQEPEVVEDSPAERYLLELRQAAQEAIDEALVLRTRADHLELDHKRLSAAADALEAPGA